MDGQDGQDGKTGKADLRFEISDFKILNPVNPAYPC
jgi:hypothetical protein